MSTSAFWSPTMTPVYFLSAVALVILFVFLDVSLAPVALVVLWLLGSGVTSIIVNRRRSGSPSQPQPPEDRASGH